MKPTINLKRTTLSYIEENKIPTSLLLLLAIQFAMIIVDRVLYLRRSMTGMVTFHVFIIIYVHAWMFLAFPLFTGRSLRSAILPTFFYVVKYVFLLMSAYQIRCGFPTRIMGNFLMKRSDIVSMIAHKL